MTTFTRIVCATSFSCLYYWEYIYNRQPPIALIQQTLLTPSILINIPYPSSLPRQSEVAACSRCSSSCRAISCRMGGWRHRRSRRRRWGGWWGLTRRRSKINIEQYRIISPYHISHFNVRKTEYHFLFQVNWTTAQAKSRLQPAKSCRKLKDQRSESKNQRTKSTNYRLQKAAPRWAFADADFRWWEGRRRRAGMKRERDREKIISETTQQG